ncbi:hypothetical protein EFO71_14635 [Lacticaseibacillus rhamnosus]|nr:hypothetical protein [Lacticaseibacillus rhamnosus]MCT3179434.1 hypothetical protein [Lacticaseibacillus rhamnosus]MCT3185402.1 hypothetical protein [Lacticaseibacillus rhamnosus]MCT4448659.1 hypothetical protein [Lacticaseibacillus rhamnosus]
MKRNPRNAFITVLRGFLFWGERTKKDESGGTQGAIFKNIGWIIVLLTLINSVLLVVQGVKIPKNSWKVFILCRFCAPRN